MCTCTGLVETPLKFGIYYITKNCAISLLNNVPWVFRLLDFYSYRYTVVKFTLILVITDLSQSGSLVVVIVVNITISYLTNSKTLL